MVKTTVKDYFEVYVRYLHNDKQQTLIKNVGKDFTESREHKNNDSKSKINEFKFNILEFDNSVGFYDLCNLCKFRFNKNDYSKDQVKKFMEDKLGEEYDFPPKWSKDKYENYKLSIRLRGYKKSINKNLSYFSTQNTGIKYPINILSYGRYNENKTSKFLLKCKLLHYIFVENCEYDLYINEYYNKLNEEEQKLVNIINTNNDFHLLNLGGSPVRNYILDWWLNRNFKNIDRIWLLDDNINYYNRFNKGNKNKIYSDLIFSSIEKYIEPYDNVGVCSHNLNNHINAEESRPIIVKNGKHYSSMLLLTDKQFRFKHKYNEDILISIDYIISGKLNFCFNHLLFDKETSGKERGGNTDTIYKNGSNEGYCDKYDYLYNELKKMYDLQLIKINGDFDKFIQCKKKVGKDKHHIINYNLLNVDNQTKFESKINNVNFDNCLELR